MIKYVTPHTDEWFEELGKYNSQQVSQTRQIISMAKSAEVCSVCGEPPIGDFHVVNSPMPKKEYSTIRLCEDCLDIRKNMHGEKLEKIK